jgi:SNF2 family DNA or RNA helicase
MISTDAGSEGLNFQFCSNLINYDLPWNPMSVEQRIGRLDRIGQKKNIKVYNLATKDTMEEHVVDLIINKMCCIGLIMGELPIILFNMGLDSSAKSGSIKFEEKLMQAFLESKNNLSRFASEVDKVGEEIKEGISDYEKTKKYTSEILD